jgi:arabinan endo-1,5-alpha-L-arabinosidase
MGALNRRAFLAGWSSLALTGCGGGGGAGDSAPTPSPSPSPSVGFTNVSVHDPSVIRVDGSFYVFGSHLAAAKSTDLMNWTRFADGVTDANPLFDTVTTELAETFAWAQVTDLWAPDVARLADGKFRMYYCACKGDSPRSALGVAVADQVEGPYVDQQILLKSGMAGTSEDGTTYDATRHPNTVDPQVFEDAAGKLWMIYGSYSGGLFIMQMDAATGLPAGAQGYGKHLMGGNHARIEGAYVLYSPDSQYYYLFCSFGGLAADGGYNIRMARSRQPDGPYVDGAGTDMATVMGAVGTVFDDASIAPHGMKLVGNHQYALAAGESGTALGYVSPGHNSAYHDASTGQYFLIFHTRFPGTGEVHEVRVHEMHLNADGWLVVAPLRYAPLSLSNDTSLTADVSAEQAAGTYKLVDHGKDISATIKTSQSIRLNADGSLGGAVSGTWLHRGSNLVDLTIGGTTFNGVLSRQWNPNANRFTVTFSAQSTGGVSVWGVRTSD